MTFAHEAERLWFIKSSLIQKKKTDIFQSISHHYHFISEYNFISINTNRKREKTAMLPPSLHPPILDFIPLQYEQFLGFCLIYFQELVAKNDFVTSN
jgi:hypothetical protein